MRSFIGLLGMLVVFAFAVPAAAQQTLSLDAALEQQLTTNGVADTANATGEELAAAIEALVANNPDLTAFDIQQLVRAAVGKNPAAYQAIALGAARAADDKGLDATAIEEILGTAINSASVNGIDTTGAASTLASAASTQTGKQISANSVQTFASDAWYEQDFFALDAASWLVGLFTIEENPNQDASPS